MNPKISIVVPVYNVEKHLKRCVESLKNQTYENLEIILVDDGSTDSSGKLCSEYKSEKIKVIHQKNKGLPAARNTGVKNATGSYIFFCDSDDWLDDNLIEKLVKNNSEKTLSGCNVKDIFEKKTSPHYRIGKIEKLEFIKEIISGKKEAFVVGYLFDAKVCRKIAFDEETRYFEDLAYLTKYLKNSNETEISFENESFYNYFQNPNSITLSRNNLEPKIKDLFLSTQKINQETNEQFKELLENREIEILEALLQDSNREQLKKIIEKFQIPNYNGTSKRIKLFINLYQKQNISGLLRYYKLRKLGKSLVLKIKMR